MAEKVECKVILNKLIFAILENNDRINNFAFFLGFLEGRSRSAKKVRSVLNDYLCVSNNNLPSKKKKKEKRIDGRQLAQYEENIGYTDIDKIEIIANAVLNETSVELPVSIDDFKSNYKKIILQNDERGKKYIDLINQYQEGDEIIEFVSSKRSWKQLFGRSSVDLVRNGETITSITKAMN